MRTIGNVFITKREVSTHEAIKRVLSLPLRTSNIDVIYVPSALKRNRTRMIKSIQVLETMNPDDTNVYSTNILERYQNRPDTLENLCLADFASSYDYASKIEIHEEQEDLCSYTEPVSHIDLVQEKSNIITLKYGLGKMRKQLGHVL